MDEEQSGDKMKSKVPLFV